MEFFTPNDPDGGVIPLRYTDVSSSICLLIVNLVISPLFIPFNVSTG